MLDKNAVEELVDPSLENEYGEEELGWVINTATLCIQQNPILRPRMSQACIQLTFSFLTFISINIYILDQSRLLITRRRGS